MNLVQLFFDIVNLSIVIAVGVYAWHKYIQPMLRKNIAQEQQEYAELVDKKTALQQEQGNIDKARHYQKEFFEKMEHNFKAWIQAEKEKHAHRQEDLKQLYEKLGKQRQQQQENFNVVCLKREQLPYIFDKTYNDLELMFQDAKKQQRYQQDVLKFLPDQKGKND